MKLRSSFLRILPLIQEHTKTLLRIAQWTLLLLVMTVLMQGHKPTTEQQGMYSGPFLFWVGMLILHIVLTRLIVPKATSNQ